MNDNEIRIATIKCRCGRDILLDQEDYERLRLFKWHCISRAVKGRCGGTRLKSISSFILPHVAGMVIDHVDRSIHDNRKSNLRYVTVTENTQNRGKHRNNSSGFKGVSFHANTGKFQAALRRNGKRIYLGLFETPEEAQQAYLQAGGCL